VTVVVVSRNDVVTSGIAVAEVAAVTARAERFTHLYSNDRHLLRACASMGLEGIDPT
jgi:hypothetical protein